MSNYYGYVSVDALMDFAHNHVNGMIDSNDIARFPKANVKDANEQQSLQEIFGIPLDRLRELAEAEREGRAVVLPPLKVGDSAWILRMTAGGYLKPICGTVSELFLIREKKVVVVVSHIGRGHYGERIFKTRAEAERALAATEPKGDAT